MKVIAFPLLLAMVLGLMMLAACGGGETAAPAVEEIDLTTLGDDVDVATVEAVRQNPGVYLLDVREPDEYAAGHIPGITLIPMGEVAARLAELPRDKEIVVTCRTGNRSSQVADLLRDMPLPPVGGETERAVGLLVHGDVVRSGQLNDEVAPPGLAGVTAGFRVAEQRQAKFFARGFEGRHVFDLGFDGREMTHGFLAWVEG